MPAGADLRKAVNGSTSGPVRLGVLELCMAGAGDGPRTAVSSVVELAVAAEQVGMTRLWLTEHHTPVVATAAPDLLLPLLGERTQRLRLGVAGVLLRLHPPFAVAERFALLSRLYAGRVDLGIARGGADGSTEAALRDGRRAADDDPPDFAGRVGRLLAALRGEHPPPTVPRAGDMSVWLLGRSAVSAAIAATLDLPYCHALFLGEPEPPPPRTAALAVAGICASSGADAEDLLARRSHSFIRPGIVGDPHYCAAALQRLAEHHGVDEILFCDLCEAPNAHLESYLLLAEALDSSAHGR